MPIKECPSCHQNFECNVDSIFQCQCYHIPLTAGQKDIIERNYDDCLCANCLLQIGLNQSINPSKK